MVQGKGYDLADPAVSGYFGTCWQGCSAPAWTPDLDPGETWRSGGPDLRRPAAHPAAAGPQAFQAVVLRAYARRCAVTGDRIRPVLQAAHILPLPGRRRPPARQRTAAPLRRAHPLRPRYLGVDPRFRLLVSPRLRDEFGNGEQFYARAGTPIRLPEHRLDRPNREFLEWHLDEVFKAS